MNGTMLYGSFQHKHPSVTKNEMVLKNPAKLLIHQPTDHNAKEFSEAKEFYISVCSHYTEI